jgi:hypothetical protein
LIHIAFPLSALSLPAALAAGLLLATHTLLAALAALVLTTVALLASTVFVVVCHDFKFKVL